MKGGGTIDFGRYFLVSIRRADYWLVEDKRVKAWAKAIPLSFNPPGGLLVG